MARTAAARKPEPVIEQDSPDVAMLKSDGNAIQAFFGNLPQSVEKARELEAHALATRNRARALVLPQTVDDDARMQMEIKAINAEKKAVEEHWSICAAFSALHRKLTAKRGIALGYLEDAGKTAQQLHNRYVDNAERARRAEEDRLRREAEDRAREDRQRALDELERQALMAEAEMENLSEREQAFVDAYVTASDGTRCGDEAAAAARAGYKDPWKAASRLMSTPKIAAAIKAKQEALAIREQAEAVKEQPLNVQVEQVERAVAPVATDRSTWVAEVYDEAAFMAAVLDPAQRLRLGIPASVVTFVQKEVNTSAKALKDKLAWPGVRAIRKVSTY